MDFTGVIKGLEMGDCPDYPHGSKRTKHVLKSREPFPAIIRGRDDEAGFEDGGRGLQMQVAWRSGGKTEKWVLPRAPEETQPCPRLDSNPGRPSRFLI